MKSSSATRGPHEKGHTIMLIVICMLGMTRLLTNKGGKGLHDKGSAQHNEQIAGFEVRLCQLEESRRKTLPKEYNVWLHQTKTCSKVPK